MASNDPWPAMSSPSHGKGSRKTRVNKKISIKEYQHNIIKNLKEMFQSNIEENIILSVANKCHYELQACIDELIIISSNNEDDKNKKKTKSPTLLPDKKIKKTKSPTMITDKKIKKTKDDTCDEEQLVNQALKLQEEIFKKYENNRGSLSKLESSSITADDKNNVHSWEHNNPKTLPGTQDMWRRENYQGKPTEQHNDNNSDICCKKSVKNSTSSDEDLDVVIASNNDSIKIVKQPTVNSSTNYSSRFLSAATTTTTTTTTTTHSDSRHIKLIQSRLNLPVDDTPIEKIKKLINDYNKVLILVRGLPGCGKTTLSKSIVESTVGGDPKKHIYSADDYFITSNGKYIYDSSKISDAHTSTQLKVLNALKLNISPVIIDNTNLQAFEMRPYVLMALQKGYFIETIDVDTPWSKDINELAKKNIHGVPKEKIRHMINRYEHGLTGEKLCDYLQLKYPVDNLPTLKSKSPVINEIDVLSNEDLTAINNLYDKFEQKEFTHTADKQSSNINEELRDRKESQSSIDDLEKINNESKHDNNHDLLLLGAIGSERKTSLVSQQDINVTSNNDDNKKRLSYERMIYNQYLKERPFISALESSNYETFKNTMPMILKDADDAEKCESENNKNDLESSECVELKEDECRSLNKHKFICEDKKVPDESDNNINKITWTEPSFPIDDIDTLKLINDEVVDKVIVNKNNAETNTTYYDFNVSYVGGTSEPGYRVINAFNRSINDGSLSQQQSERPPVKLMFDKSSMTGGFYTEDGNFIIDADNDDEKTNRLPELIELFPHIPSVYLHEIYEKVNNDFDWAVDVLLEVAQEYTSFELPSSGKNSSVSESPTSDRKEESDGTSETRSSSSSLGLHIDTKSNSTSDTDTNITSASALVLAPPLPRPPLMSSSSTSSSTSSSENKNNDDDDDDNDTMELNLGFDFIKSLIEQFGNAGLQETTKFSPVVRITKAMGEKLHALWIESISQQMNKQQNLLDELIAKDAEYAKSLDCQQHNEAKNKEKNVPSIDDILDMEMALAIFENEKKPILERETHDDMMLRLSKKILHDSHPHFDLSEFKKILDIHNGNYHEAIKTIESSSGKKILSSYINKQKYLMDKVKEETKTSIHSTKFHPKPLSYKAVLMSAKKTRKNAEHQASLRFKNITKAEEMYRKGFTDVAEYYSNLATLQMRNNDNAVANEKGTDDSIDLHFLTVSDALNVVENFIDTHISKINQSGIKKTTLSIITGWGARSNGTPKIKPAVEKYFIKRSIKYDEDNLGCLTVTLHRGKTYSPSPDKKATMNDIHSYINKLISAKKN